MTTPASSASTASNNQANSSPPASPGAAASPPPLNGSFDNESGESPPEDPSFDERRRRASDRKSPSRPAANVWQHYADQRRQAAKAAKDDVGYHRPTMEQLAPVLALAETPSVTGREHFEAFETAIPTSHRPVVAYMHMDAGFFINQIDEGKALRVVLHDQQNEGIDDGLAELVQLKVDTNSRQLIWGLASLDAIAILENKSFKIPTRDGSQTFIMKAKSALDGYFLDILGFDANREVKAHLWDVLHAAGATPISGLYTNTSESLGTTGSRYRITFKSTSPPPMFNANGRTIDEIILMGKCYRVYGSDWYNHRKQAQRIDLDILAREKKIPLPGAKPVQASKNARPVQDGKRQRTDTEPGLPWELVRKGAKLGTTSDPLPWDSPNMYQALDERVIVSTKQVASANGSDITILPIILERPDAPISIPHDAFVCGTKPHRNRATRAKMSLNTTLDELAALDVAVAEAQASFDTYCTTAATKTKLNLAKFIQDGEADWIQRDLEDHPVVFRRQLRELAMSSLHLLLPLVQLTPESVAPCDPRCIAPLSQTLR
ncbi:hypothetical protein AC1031_012036 [Aphanomyces cochlioides]|nr:hypothetical protein AC1031_012036 [Aphanomyces cochlioides]